ncbi:CAMK protein kinase [Saprolegnia parasitica CBS 223.65]|uniref:CAMK protein kinase n=1 Tax=Saprolegnia parasitica (strain CBS 223.65) TaxID=695850 RepID=A0A067CSS6_SAPPC|nr:CAMK protein kinase [Saprolegnia parasitica CBS 223.65]KDO29852.1 CAMK protein kinase [Saprolegnia parasitica CBS 223.65]|eukprot:XP_012199552.1 CAMK protein kinase [Saprolegnia parasitica CBS 223.65]
MGACSGHALAMEDAYTLEQNGLIGCGAHSKVLRATHKTTGEKVAVKLLFASTTLDRSAWEAQVRLMKQLDPHPNIIRLFETYETEEYVCLVMELADGGELFQMLVRDGAYSEAIAQQYVRDILTALQYLHEKGIVHRDLKPENLLLTSKHAGRAHVKLADFSMAAIVTSKRLAAKGGLTWAYCAPELLDDDDDGSATYDGKSDMWSLGVILYIILSAVHPFDPDGRHGKDNIVAAIRHGEFHMDGEVWRDISDEAKDLVQKLLTKDPAARISAADALGHPWLSKDDLSSLPLQCSLNLTAYLKAMHRRFRVSVIATMAAARLASVKAAPVDVRDVHVAADDESGDEPNAAAALTESTSQASVSAETTTHAQS